VPAVFVDLEQPDLPAARESLLAAANVPATK